MHYLLSHVLVLYLAFGLEVVVRLICALRRKEHSRKSGIAFKQLSRQLDRRKRTIHPPTKTFISYSSHKESRLKQTISIFLWQQSSISKHFSQSLLEISTDDLSSLHEAPHHKTSSRSQFTTIQMAVIRSLYVRCHCQLRLLVKFADKSCMNMIRRYSQHFSHQNRHLVLCIFFLNSKTSASTTSAERWTMPRSEHCFSMRFRMVLAMSVVSVGTRCWM